MKVRIFTILVSLIAATTGFAQCEYCAAQVQMEGSDSNSDVTLAAYFEIQRALANDDFKASSTVAVALHEKTSKMTCPIEDEAWLQDNPDLRNPYHGAVMIKCGMQQAVIGKQ